MRKAVNHNWLPILFGLGSAALFIGFQNYGLGGGDSGDLVTAALTFGVSHPPGYPLFVLFGHILGFLPFGTPAFRIGFLSSIPHAFVVSFVTWYVYSRTKKIFPTVMTVTFLVGNYLFFLYSVTQEVFALYHLFLISVVFLLMTERKQWSTTIYALIAFLYGISVAHHHLIFFTLPVTLWCGMQTLKGKSLWKIALYTLSGFLVGLLPLVTVFIAARGTSPINWNRPVDLVGFTRLLTRADYGTFQSGGAYGNLPIERVLSVVAYFRFFFVDFHFIGILFFIVGLVWMIQKKRKEAEIILALLLFLGPIFFFYASFPFVNHFTIGTYERFLIGSYILAVPIMGIGAWRIRDLLIDYLGRILPYPKSIHWSLSILIFLFPAITLYTTLFRMAPLIHDKTIENIGQDLLQSLPPKTLLLVAGDTALFSAQYERYVLHVRPDVYVLHESRLFAREYPIILKKLFPELTIPEESKETFRMALLKANTNLPIYSRQRGDTPDGYAWVPEGMLYRMTPIDTIPSLDEIIATNSAIFSQMHNPLNGALSVYPHLLLSDVLNVYSSGYGEFGKLLLKAGKTNDAKEYLTQAVALSQDTQSAAYNYYLGLSLAVQNHCTEAFSAIKDGNALSYGKDPDALYYEAFVYSDCVHDATKAATLKAQYEKTANKNSDLLEKAR